MSSYAAKLVGPPMSLLNFVRTSFSTAERCTQHPTPTNWYKIESVYKLSPQPTGTRARYVLGTSGSQYDQLLEFPHECTNYSTTFPVFEGSQIALKSQAISGIFDFAPHLFAAAQRGDVRGQVWRINRFKNTL